MKKWRERILITTGLFMYVLANHLSTTWNLY